MKNQRIAACGLLLFFFAAWNTVAASPPALGDVSIAPAFFNPTVGQQATITFRAAASGTARVTILDRDRFVIRTLKPVAVQPGQVSIPWDGRDDRSAVVPDEAWNVRIELAGQVYDPSHHHVPVSEDPQPRMYSRMDGVLSYRLARPARVHIEAGQASPDEKRRRMEGPIMKTIVNREPRAAGAIVERWNGFDESGTIQVAALRNFVISVLATSLPDSSIITRGNRQLSFLDYARQRRPASALVAAKRAAPTHHHAGLNAFEDISPALDVKRSWTRDGALRLEVRVAGPGSAHFLRQPGNATVYVDEERVLQREKPSSPMVLTIPAKQLAGGERRIVVNWDSDFGPGAAASFLIGTPSKRAVRTGAGR